MLVVVFGCLFGRVWHSISCGCRMLGCKGVAHCWFWLLDAYLEGCGIALVVVVGGLVVRVWNSVGCGCWKLICKGVAQCWLFFRR